ncbi:hypothetical protein WJX73_009511 [Symbiochloris irregularis]|uniref:Carbohydrate kinase PfkB domain-containing protein n=1 Tax=Symbiochloris irregularis TaxID=706552 RepID=A0AAW1P6X2_9CHLO
MTDRVLFVGDPVVDRLVRVDCSLLREQAIEPAGCVSISTEEMDSLLQVLQARHLMVRACDGGSAANGAKAYAQLQPAGEVGFMGMIGPDAPGKSYEAGLMEKGVRPHLVQSPTGSPTATCLCLVTEDGERTMRTCLSAAGELKLPEQLPEGWADNCRAVHLEGYCLYRPQLAEHIMTTARTKGALVSLDLASYEVVNNNHATLLRWMQQGLLNLVFCNLEEAQALAKVVGLTKTDQMEDDLLQGLALQVTHLCQTFIVSLGARGCKAWSRVRPATHRTSSDDSSQPESASAPAPKVQVVDTVGAGDCLIAGFLYGYLSGACIQQCVE